MFELKWQNTFYKLFLGCVNSPLLVSRVVREIECSRSLSEGDRKLTNLQESMLGKIARKERGIFVQFVFMYFHGYHPWYF